MYLALEVPTGSQYSIWRRKFPPASVHLPLYLRTPQALEMATIRAAIKTVPTRSTGCIKDRRALGVLASAVRYSQNAPHNQFCQRQIRHSDRSWLW